jgi:hypothetical protein
MKRALPSILLALALMGRASAASGLELTLSWPHPESATPERVIGSLSFFQTGGSPWPGFSEWGFTAMPQLRRAVAPASLAGKVDSFVGGYAGHVFPLWGGLVRPGFQLGSLWEETWTGNGDGTRGRLGLYYAFRVQTSCLSFILSNRGQGLGVNFSL